MRGEIAEKMGRKPVGTLRLLARLNLEGRALEVEILVQKLRRDLAFRVSDEVVRQAITSQRSLFDHIFQIMTGLLMAEDRHRVYKRRTTRRDKARNQRDHQQHDRGSHQRPWISSGYSV